MLRPSQIEERNKIIRDNFYSNYNFKIGNNVWIGGGTKIVGGVSIGDNTVIEAGR